MPTPYSTRPKVTQRDISNGFVTRYFVQQISTKLITEVDKKQYEAFKKNVLYEYVDFPWVITGLANDTLATDGNIIYGTKHKNTVTTAFYNKKMPGLTRLLSNPLEGFQGTRNPELVVPISQPTYNSDVAGTGTGRTFTNWTFIPPVVAPPTSSSYTILNLAQGESSTFVLRSDNTLWSWGWNGSGQLGLGAELFTDVYTPTQVPGNCWSDVQAGAYNMFAITSDNTLWAAGNNDYGQLGNGDTSDRISMTQVPGTNWSKVSPSINYGNHTLGLKTDGTLWAWGDNTWGELGNGTTGNVETSPMQVGSDTDWSYIHAGYLRSFAIKTDGTLWSWGDGSRGVLGIGEYEFPYQYPTPTQVGSSYSKVSSAWSATFAIKTNGTLWVCGRNYSGMLGVGSSDTDLIYDTFTQIGSDTDWADIVCGYEQCYATKTNGRVYVWGYNGNEYCLGLGDTTDRNTPTAIDSDTDWSLVRAGTYSGLASKGGNLTVWGDMFDDYHGVSDQGTAVSVPTTSDFSNTLLTSATASVVPYLGVSPTSINFAFTQSASLPSTQEIYITEICGDSVSGLYITSESNWFSASLSATTTPTTMSVAISSTQLAGITFTSSIIVSSSTTQITSPITLPVTASVASIIQPDYWWRADIGLTTSSWTASKGGYNFTLSNVTTSNAIVGAEFNGRDGFGLTQNLTSNIAATHVLMRIDALPTNTGSLSINSLQERDTLLGSTQDNIHELGAFVPSIPAGAFLWYVIDDPSPAAPLRYAARTGVKISSPTASALWFNFESGSAPLVYTDNNDTIKATFSIYSGTYNNRFTWTSGSGIYLARRKEVLSNLGHMRVNVKELAIFTSSRTYAEIDAFRDDMLARWP